MSDNNNNNESWSLTVYFIFCVLFAVVGVWFLSYFMWVVWAFVGYVAVVAVLTIVALVIGLAIILNIRGIG